MTGFDASKVVIREVGAADAGRLSLVADATFLETFAGMISGEALVAHRGCAESGGAWFGNPLHNP